MAGSWTPLPGEVPECTRALLSELRLLKDRSGLNLVQLGERTNYSKSSWERWLNGKSRVPSRAIVSMATACGGDPGRLLTLWERANLEQLTESDTGDGAAEGGARAPAPRRWPLPRALTRRRAVAGGLLVGLVGLGTVALATRGNGEGRPAGSAPPASCRMHGCDNRDPQALGCAADAQTLTSSSHPAMTVYLRYSPSCQAAWGRITDAHPGDTVTVVTSDGASATMPIHYGRDVYTQMVGVTRSAAVWSCGATAQASICTSKQHPAPAAG
jgi:hypothetical protein